VHREKEAKIAEAEMKKKMKDNPPKEEEEEDSDEEEVVKKAKPPSKLLLCTESTKYRVIKKACRRHDFRLHDDVNLDWDMYWSDTGILPQLI